MKTAIILMMTIVMLSGCASKSTGSINTFGLAAADVTSKIDAVISDYNNANVNDELVRMAQSSRKFTKSDMEPIKSIVIRDTDKKNFALYKANQALGNYAKSLSDLATASSTEELSLAGAKLATSLKAMNDQYQTLKQTKSDLISTKNSAKISRMITQLSSYYVESKRAKALKAVIIAANSSVQGIGRVINDQLLKGVIAGRLYTMRGTELAGYFDDYNAKVAKLSFVKKKKMLDVIYKKYITMESATATVFQAQKAISSVMKAHAQMTVELTKGRFNSEKIINAIKNIKSVHQNFDDLENLMISCETEIIADQEKGIICK